MTITSDMTLGDLVDRHPLAADVLEEFALDYCCHGQRTLAEACRAAEVDADVVVSRLELAASDDSGPAPWHQLDLPALADHIVEVHHRYLDKELPRLEALADKVRTAHAERHRELHNVRHLVLELRRDLEPHLAKEELVLFPAIRAMSEGRSEPSWDELQDPIRVMTAEHERAGDLLASLRQVTGGYRVPADGCASYRSLYERLEALERDTHLHVCKENHTLFPAAMALAARG